MGSGYQQRAAGAELHVGRIQGGNVVGSEPIHDFEPSPDGPHLQDAAAQVGTAAVTVEGAVARCQKDVTASVGGGALAGLPNAALLPIGCIDVGGSLPEGGGVVAEHPSVIGPL